MRGVGVVTPGAATSLHQFGQSASERRLDPGEVALFAAFAAVSVWVLGLDLWQVVVNGRVWTGTDGVYITDQMQYLGWIVSASRHLLVANLFVVHSTPAVYFQPAIAVSGLLTAVGVAPALSLLLWKPVAVVAFYWAVRAYVQRTLPDRGRGARLAAIALALFYGSFSIVYGQFGVVGDLFPGFLAWGYPFALMAVAALVFALLSYDAARSAGRVSWTPGLLGALAGSLHPWQGEAFLLVLIGAELSGGIGAVIRRDGWGAARVRLAAITLALAALPLVYYYALGKLDLSWELGRLASKHGFPVLAIVLALAPLAIVALLGLRGTAAGFLSRTTWLWPLAALVVWAQSVTSQGATPLHAFDGVTLPLGVLAVSGCLRAGWRRMRADLAIGVAVVAALTIPTTIYEMSGARADVRPTPGNANFISRDESRALAFLRSDRVPCGVFTRFYLGAAVPARTGRHTYVGDCIWSEPNCNERSDVARDLLSGQFSPARVQQVVGSSGARFVLSDCQDHADLTRDLGPLLQSVEHFGCATVYQVSG